MRNLVFFWSVLEHLHTLQFAIDLSGFADLDGQTVLLLATLATTLMTYRRLDDRAGRRGTPRRRNRK